MATRRTTKKTVPTVGLVGAGAGDPGLLTLRAAELLAAAELVVTDPTVSHGVLAMVDPGAELAMAGPEAGAAGAACAAAAKAGRRTVRLYAGDPFLSPSGTADALALAKAKVPFEVAPGVPPAVAVPAYAGIPLGLPRVVASLDDGADPSGLAALADVPGPLVVSAPVNAVGKVAAALVEHGRPGDTPVAVTSLGTTTSQRTVVTTLDRAEADLAGTAYAMVSPVVVTIGAPVAQRDKLSWFETTALFGWRVLVPRTREQAGAAAELLRAQGAEPLEVPTIAVEAPRTAAPMERAVRGLVTGRYQWVAFTSANAVRAVREKLEEVGLDARAFAGVKIAAVGEATAAVLADFGLRADLLPSGDQSSDGLLADFPDYDDLLDPLDRVFLPRADIATEGLVGGLKERGWAVDDVTAYRTVRATPPPAPVREAIKTGGVDAVLFTSSSTVRNLLGIAGKPHERTVIACIGPQTAATARELGLRVDVQPPEATVGSLVAALAEFAVARRADEQAAEAERAERAAAEAPAKTKRRR